MSEIFSKNTSSLQIIYNHFGKTFGRRIDIDLSKAGDEEINKAIDKLKVVLLFLRKNKSLILKNNKRILFKNILSRNE